MNKQSARKEVSSSTPKAPRKPLKNGASSEEVCSKGKNVSDETKAKAKATPAKTGKNSTSVKKNPDKSAAKSGSNPKSQSKIQKEIEAMCLDKNSIHYYINKRKEEEKVRGIETCSSANTDKRQIDRIVYDEELNSYITYFDNGEFEYGYVDEDETENVDKNAIANGNAITNSDTTANQGHADKKDIKKKYRKRTPNKNGKKGAPRGLVSAKKEIYPSFGAVVRGTIVVIVLLCVAIDIFLVRPYEQKREELYAPRKYKSHFNLDPNRPLTEIGDLDYENRTVTYTSPMPKDTILPPSPLPKLTKEDYLEEPLNLYEDYYEMFYDYYHD